MGAAERGYPPPELPSVAAGAVSSAGRAPALHAGGRRFESCTAHLSDIALTLGSCPPPLSVVAATKRLVRSLVSFSRRILGQPPSREPDGCVLMRCGRSGSGCRIRHHRSSGPG